MISHDEAQELHRIIGSPLGWPLDADNIHEVRINRVELERALELAALIVSDTDPDNAPKDTSIDIYLTGDKDGPDMFGVIYDDEDGVLETARENDECAWRVPVQPNLDGAALIHEYKDEPDE